MKFRTHAKLKTARKYAEGQPVLRVGNHDGFYVTGVSQLDEVSVVAPSGSITGHIILKHLDRLGNANYALANDPHVHVEHAYEQPQEQRVNLIMTPAEAMALWAHVERIAASEESENKQEMRWICNRLARLNTQRIDATDKETVAV